jgi:peptidoglycan hydrolase-like protein with peptidoglycan-binding domain
MTTPSPRSMPELWDSCVIGTFTIPPVKQRGTVKVSVTPSIKKDDKKKPGKDGSKPAIERVEPEKIEVEFTFNEEIWEQVAPIIKGLKPDGKPRDIFHPLTDVYDVASFLIDQASPVDFNNGVMSITWSGESWKPAAGTGQQVILRRGSRGPEVTRWQTFLAEQKFGEPEGFSPIDGIFGILTEDGTKGFQTREAIKVDGIVGPETFGAAAKFGYVPPPPIQGGQGGGGVKTPEEAVAAAATDLAGDVADAAGEVADAVTDAAEAFLGGGENGDSSSGEASGEGSGGGPDGTSGGATSGGSPGS